jgi:putative DNA primase/helicase
MGLCLTAITKFQKVLFLVGPKRSGKGTIARVLQKIVGNHNFVTPSTSDFGQNLGLEAFIGKTLAIVSDARFDKRNSSQVIERVLTISGEDTITIPRKYRDAIILRLPTKLMFLSNEIPIIIDQSGAFASRFIFLKLPNSFYGKEDLELESKLSLELPGIFRLAIEYLEVLLQRGHFIQPETGKSLLLRMTTLSSPVGDFKKQLTPYMTKDKIWEKWEAFCINEGLWPKIGTKNALWNNLESAGYNCDFDTADILAKIRQHDGEARIRDFRDCTFKYRQDGGTEVLRRKLDEMIKAGLLTSRHEKAANGQSVEYFAIAITLDDSCEGDT